MNDYIKSLSEKIYPEVVSIRRDLHRYPELSFEEKFTSNYILEFLKTCKLEPKLVEDAYSVVCDMCNDDTKHKILFRADIDALPIEEETGLEYTSINKGIMHACGHDIHTAILLGIAKVLSENTDKLKYNVRLIFQSGEEQSPGGAIHIVNKGYVKKEDISAAYGFHVSPELHSGVIGLCSGYFMAATDEIHIKVIGKGGHAAKPAEFVNPIYLASQIVIQLTDRPFQTREKYILSIGKFIGNGATNIIPNKVELAGTLRTFDEVDRHYLHKMIKDVCNKVKLFNAKVELSLTGGYPSLYNDPKLTTQVSKTLECLLGHQQIKFIPQRMTADDFSYISREVPSCYIRLGCGTKTKQHTSKFNPNEECMKHGLAAGIALICK